MALNMCSSDTHPVPQSEADGPSPVTRPRRYKVVSLFSGAMGLDLGLEQTGRFEVVAAIEIERSFCETIRVNQKDGRLSKGLKVFEGDAKELDPKQLLDKVGLKPGEVDLLVGGPPCQTFSTAGRRRAIQDPRGTLLWEFLRWIRILEPRFFIIENVRGLLSAALKHRRIAERPEKGGVPLSPDEEPGSVVRRFANELQQLPSNAYHMDCFEVNAVNYGAPQLRERALFIGNRYNAIVEFPAPTHARMPSPDGLLPWRTLGDAIKGLIEIDPVIMDFSPRKRAYLSRVPPGSNWRSLPPNMQRESMGRAWYAKGGRSGWWRRLSFDLPCPTLVTMPNHASTALCHPTEVRALTLREYACIQEFPADWKFCGTPAEQYAQAGNAVPLRLGHVAGDVVANELDTLRECGWLPRSDPPSAYRVNYVQSHVRTRQWFKSGTTYVWQDGTAENTAIYAAPRTIRKSTVIKEALEGPVRKRA
jgi:DNA (cytosine-5)-methyltransferase 1